MSAPLSNHQKAYLAQLARRAHRAWSAQPEQDGRESNPDQWRQDQVAVATGKKGLRCCGQDDYKLIEAHFLNMLDDPAGAFRAHMRAATEPRRVARYKLEQTCADFGFSLNYADAICRRQHRGLTIDDISENQLWQLTFTIKNRGLAKRRSTTNAHTN